MKFLIHIHIHIHRFCMDIDGYIRIHRCLFCIDLSIDCPQSTVGFYCLLILKIYKSKIKCLHLIKPKICIRTCMHVVITCNYSCKYKMKKMKQTKSQGHLVISQVFVLYFIFVRISSILFNSFFNSSSLIEIHKRSIHFLYFFFYRM